MAKELTPKKRVIREAILANPDAGPKALARLINEAEQREHDKIHVTPGDVPVLGTAAAGDARVARLPVVPLG